MKFVYFWGFCCLLLGLSACHSLDDDTRYNPKSKGYVLLAKQSQNTALLYAHAGGIQTFSSQLDGEATQVFVKGEQAFVPEPNQHQVSIFNLNSGELSDKISLKESFHPSCLLMTDDFKNLAIIGSTTGELAFYNTKKKTVDFVQYTDALSQLQYNNGKLYGTSTTSDKIIIVDVRSHALLKSESKFKVQFSVIAGLDFVAFSQDSLTQQYKINVNDDLVRDATPYSYTLQQLAYSPYNQQFYGKEYIGSSLLLYGNNIYFNGIDLKRKDIAGFIPDFDESKIAVFSATSLSQYENMTSLIRRDSLPNNTSILMGAVHRK